MFRLILTVLFTAIFLQSPAAEFGYRIVKTYPHDRTAFTQGLEYKDGVLYEGTGLVGQSQLRKLDIDTGRVLERFDVPQPFFGEGITVLPRQIVQLTWQSQTGFIYDRATFHMLKSFAYSGEGWGITNDGKQLFMTDGTPQIRILDPETLKETRRITVRDGARPVAMLNELEYVRGELLVNVWQTDRIARVSPSDGRVTGWIDFSGLSKANKLSADAVLNGIAYDSARDRLFVTGKLWPNIYEVQIVPKK